MVQRIILLPLGIIGGIIAGSLAAKLFDRVWAMFDKQEPPSPEHRDASWAKLAAALVIEGAIFRLVRGLIDRGTRTAVLKATGSWPGEERPS
jgi:hypothetical protein